MSEHRNKKKVSIGVPKYIKYNTASPLLWGKLNGIFKSKF